MDPLFTEEEQTPRGGMFNPISFALQFLASYGWYIVGGAAAALYALHRLRPALARWRLAREDAEYHKNPDVALARLEALQRAREQQQRQLEAASQRALQLQAEREEKRREEAAERLRKYAAQPGERLGRPEKGDDYMPLSAGASTSSYRPPKKSKCGGGGCGR